MNKIRIAAIGALAALLAVPVTAAEPAKAKSLNDAYATLASKTFVDLTHTFGPTTPHWKGFGEETVNVLYTIPKDGFKVQQFTHVGQWGTHIDPPAHFHDGLRTVDQVPLSQMLMPLVVLDVHEKVAKNPDYTLTIDDVKAWEKKHGRIPANAFVAMRTDWSKRWPCTSTRPPVTEAPRSPVRDARRPRQGAGGWRDRARVVAEA